jgi:hypothetical protein
MEKKPLVMLNGTELKAVFTASKGGIKAISVVLFVLMHGKVNREQNAVIRDAQARNGADRDCPTKSASSPDRSAQVVQEVGRIQVKPGITVADRVELQNGRIPAQGKLKTDQITKILYPHVERHRTAYPGSRRPCCPRSDPNRHWNSPEH